MDFSERNPLSVSSLSAAVEQNAVEILHELIKKGRNCNIVDNRGWTPLHVAASLGHTECLKVLLTAGARLNTKSHQGETPFYFACKSNHMDVVDLLFRSSKHVVHTTNNESVTPLHIACSERNLTLAHYLIKRKININKRDSSGVTPLHEAVLNNDVEMCKLLLKNGVDLNVTELDGNLPLHFACMMGNIEIVRLLISNYKGDLRSFIESVNNDRFTPLMFAVQSKSIDVIEEILKLGATTESKSRTSALHLAAHSGNLHILKRILNLTSNESIADFCTVTKTEARFSKDYEVTEKNSLVSLVIDTESMDCLKYILNCGLKGDVLNSPIITKDKLEPMPTFFKDMHNYASYGPYHNVVIEINLNDVEIHEVSDYRIIWIHPITFLFKDKMSDLRKDTVKYLKVMLESGYLCDDYSDYVKENVIVLHPLEGLMFGYQMTGESCKDIVLECFNLLIEHGYCVDSMCKLYDYESIPILFVYACRLPFFELIPLLLQHSTLMDIDDLIKWVVHKIFLRIVPPYAIEKNLFDSYKLLIQYTPKSINNFLKDIRKAGYKSRVDAITCFIDNENLHRVLSLKVLCRSVIRNTIRANCQSFPHQFKIQLNSLELPLSLHDFMNYSDMIGDIKKL